MWFFPQARIWRYIAIWRPVSRYGLALPRGTVSPYPMPEVAKAEEPIGLKNICSLQSKHHSIVG
jgi:hypothetical protein